MPTVAGSLTLTPASVSFKGKGVGVRSKLKRIHASNRGTQTISLLGTQISGDFQLAARTCGTSLLPRKKCIYSIVFVPSATGQRTGTLTILNNGASGKRTVSLGGSAK
jgi:hypothetical protein